MEINDIERANPALTEHNCGNLNVSDHPRLAPLPRVPGSNFDPARSTGSDIPEHHSINGSAVNPNPNEEHNPPIESAGRQSNSQGQKPTSAPDGTARHIRSHPTPYEIYRQSAIHDHGYDPEQLTQRMITLQDGSEWLPKTFRHIDHYFDTNGAYNLPKWVLEVVKTKRNQGSTEAARIWREIRGD